jgi:hypothetical protein
MPQGTRAVQIFDGGADKDTFLKNFGSSKRETVCACEVRTDATLTQMLSMVNGAQIDSVLQRSAFLNTLAAEKDLEPQRAVERIFLKALARKPTENESASLIEPFASADPKDPNIRRKLYEDILWSAMNTTEFMFNH